MTSPESPDMDRLREVVTEAIDAVIDGWMQGDPWPDDERLAAAVLAALLPVHRAMVLRKTQGDPEPCPLDHSCAEDESCGCWCDLHDCALDECPTFKTVEAWIKGMQEKHEAALRRLAASTPPGAPGSPQTAERATPTETGSVEPERRSAGCADCDEVCDEKCACPGCTAPPAVVSTAGDNQTACDRCRRRFDPDDKDPAGAARYAESKFCRGCVDRCHESTDAFHECPVCAS